MALDLSPYALTTVTRLKSHLGRASIGESDVADRATAAINRATAWMERATGRKLKARNWRTAFDVQCSATINVASSFVAGTSGLIKRGDDIRSYSGSPAATDYIALGSQVTAYTDSNGHFTASIAPTATVAQEYATFGSVPLVCDGTGCNVLDTPQWPLQELWAAYSVDAAGNRSALSITSMRLHKAAGTIELGADSFPLGERNIELECRAGYEQPTTLVRGDVDEWNALEGICLRVAEVYYSDALNQRGRQTDISMGGLSASVGSYDMPADIVADIRQFVRTR